MSLVPQVYDYIELHLVEDEPGEEYEIVQTWELRYQVHNATAQSVQLGAGNRRDAIEEACGTLGISEDDLEIFG